MITKTIQVALYLRAWIEIATIPFYIDLPEVALYLRAWIEIENVKRGNRESAVALYLRAWIEIISKIWCYMGYPGRSLLESVD